jgi:2-phospho-L-lactate/phosphoenolpyruvate guanylyltransferase
MNGYMKYTALVPVKSLVTAKSRLVPDLPPNRREMLVLDMLYHVLRVLQDSKLFERVSVVSPDARVLEQVRAWGAWALIEERPGHNPALYAAALRERAEGATALLTISADLPLLSTQEIRNLLEQSRQYEVVLAASRDGAGTNAILVRPPLAVPYLFGPDSLQRYLEAARQRHLSHTIYGSTGLAFDIDTIVDLRELEAVS